ncbi:hypothetical protein Aspvir_003267 [Aspergillus viridinutans]|uniref:RNase III domain-containing protein n=1 Tax=Aspergillus viridinutans TaxID=75553 RepID=A0A9P3FB38_ASPVI|nr:uncharacterized protein Aspvir_003267 [Aspergillus viridinutans]GIK07601.1 hypothetical protein Aspvir_003267 [Aspergillus viridinutans]
MANRKNAKRGIEKVMDTAQGRPHLESYATNKAMTHQAIRLHLGTFARPGPAQSQQKALGVHGLGTEIEALVAAVWINSQWNVEVVKNAMKHLHLCPEHV